MKKVFEIEWDDDDIILDAEKVKNCLNSVIHYNAYTTNVVELPQEERKCSCNKPSYLSHKVNGKAYCLYCCGLMPEQKPKKIEKLRLIPVKYNAGNYDIFDDVKNCVDKINEIITKLENL